MRHDMTGFIGRTQEIQRLNQLLDKSTASFVVVYGRRRIGKSSLIEHFGKNHRMLSFEGLSPRKAITTQDQLNEFSRQLARQCHTQYTRFTDWGDAFYELSKHTQRGRMVVLLDEISWLALEDPDFPSKVKMAWDKYFKKNPKLIFFACGSVSTWIKRNIVNNTGFHGRISLKLNLRELPLNVCKKFWAPHESKISNAEKLKVISVTGGIPKYLEEINPKITAEENTRRMAFTEGGILFNDFSDIFTDTLMRKTDIYEKIVRLLSDGSVDSKDISKKINVAKGKYLSELLDELQTAGFITRSSKWDLKTGKISTISEYRLSDNYIRFYLKYIEPNSEKIIAGNFADRSLTSLPGWSSIMSLQVENLVLNNREKIKSLLNIKPDEIICDNPYLQRASGRIQGCQIDYLIQTKFDNLYVCEIKYSRYPIKNGVIDEVKEKINRLKIPKHTSIRPVLIYLGDVHDEVVDANYFTQIINIEELLES
jgi:AAA+ ATPase superfamily predicted ATPase